MGLQVVGSKAGLGRFQTADRVSGRSPGLNFLGVGQLNGAGIFRQHLQDSLSIHHVFSAIGAAFPHHFHHLSASPYHFSPLASQSPYFLNFQRNRSTVDNMNNILLSLSLFYIRFSRKVHYQNFMDSSIFFIKQIKSCRSRHNI